MDENVKGADGRTDIVLPAVVALAHRVDGVAERETVASTEGAVSR